MSAVTLHNEVLPKTEGTISAALVAAQSEMPMIGFDADNPFFRSRYASLGAVISGTNPVLKKHGLAIYQVPTTDGCTVSLKTTIMHASGQTLDGGTLSLEIGEVKGKALIQEIGSIITYFRRYAWASVCGVYSDEDTDGNTSKQQHGEAPDDSKPKKAVPTEKTRLWALNKLQAAPGQPNRDIFTAWLRFKGWGQEPEQWDLKHVVASIAGLQALAQEIAQWDIERHKPADDVPM